MRFEFATATRIIFGSGKLNEIGALAGEFGQSALIVVGGNPQRAQPLIDKLNAAGIVTTIFSIEREPQIADMQTGTQAAKGCDMVISFGGGSALDAGKAIAALTTNEGHPLDYLEVIGKGQKLVNDPLPFIAIPTTAGTGAEVTKNAVLASPEHRVKVSLRSNKMLPAIALVDPELTLSLPQAITASTGMDALTQCIEPYVSNAATLITDLFAREGIKLAARSLRRVYQNGGDLSAREDMALASLYGGLALANAKLGAVHGFAGVLGGMYDAPHGAVCAALLPHVMLTNIEALTKRDLNNPVLNRFDEIGRILSGDDKANAYEAVAWIQETAKLLNIAALGEYGVQANDFEAIVEKSAGSSSMKGNPITLTPDEMATILKVATG